MKRTKCCKQQKIIKFLSIFHVAVICNIVLCDSCYFGAFQIVGVDDLKINFLKLNLNLQGASSGQQSCSQANLPFPPFSIATFFNASLVSFTRLLSLYQPSLKRIYSFFWILFHRITESLCYKGPLEIFLY